jgi:outer membrane protein OmpA-like peptidoglycan-associated protein
MSKLSEKIGWTKTLYSNNLWQGRLLLTTLIILLILTIVRVSLPYTIVYSATYWLDKQGVTSQIEDISINVIQGTFSIINASGSKNGDQVFNIGMAEIDWEWAPLSTKTIVVKHVLLEDLDLEAEQYSDGIVIAGITIRNDGTVEQQPAEEEQPVAWSTALNHVDFRDMRFCFQQHDTLLGNRTENSTIIDYCASAGLFAWQGNISLTSDKTSSSEQTSHLIVEGTLKLKQLSLLNNALEASLINLGDIALSNIDINGINDIKLGEIDIKELQLLQRTGHTTHEHAVEFNKIDISDISFNNMDTLAIRKISLDKPRLSSARDDTGAWKYEQWIHEDKRTSDTSAQNSSPSSNESQAFKINVESILISDAELCYEQPAVASAAITQAIDYCLDIASTDWNGSISVSTPTPEHPLGLVLTGDLNLAGFVTTNNLLQRDLMTFDKLAINKINIQSTDNLAFGKLNLDKLNGLELTSAEDKHTLAISSLDIATFAYANNSLAINKVAVNDLALELTQNADGTFDFEKWKIKTAEAQSNDNTASDTSTTEPLKIKLGEFSLDTTRTVEFTDLSVEPSMPIGFSELHVSVKDLDSENPDQQSPVSLNAKTTRHGTIEIAGVAKPFDSKPSFDATGKISGLDLRAASPKAEQTIGHIIKSGQLDADLKLLSVEGQLDSNIGLVLHHFNLKAKSKEDAAALDDVFGMPINQSLVLLKDKKGTIKLDIPITGDINNPDFDPTDAIIKATAKATTVTLITFYTPYGLAFAGGNMLFNIATAMNFEPLLFEPGSAKLTDAHEEQLGKLAELLTERPAVHLTLCGFTNLNDRDKMFTEIIDRKKIKPPTAERLTKLKKLGAERQDNVKDYLISVGKIEHGRLILCEPEHSDDSDALAGVEISI